MERFRLKTNEWAAPYALRGQLDIHMLQVVRLYPEYFTEEENDHFKYLYSRIRRMGELTDAERRDVDFAFATIVNSEGGR